MTAQSKVEAATLPDYECWRPALIAFYERDEMRQKALNLKHGASFDYLDIRTIEALEAALAEVRGIT